MKRSLRAPSRSWFQYGYLRLKCGGVEQAVYTLFVLPETFAICRLPCDAPVPPWATGISLTSVTRGSAELSIVCPEGYVPREVTAERGWQGLCLAGKLNFSLVGVLASLLQPLADVDIPVFVLSTFTTDYVLVRASDLQRAVIVLESLGHRVVSNPDARKW
jgi:hypothetical protein